MDTPAANLNDSPLWINVTPSGLWRVKHARKALRAVVKELSRDRNAWNQLDVIREAALIKVRQRSARTAIPLAFCINVLCDLSAQGWTLRTRGHKVEALVPTNGLNAGDEKLRVRAAHVLDRDAQLRQPSVRAFVADLERTRLHKGEWHSIFSLMRDGRELADKLRGASVLQDTIDREATLGAVIDPYIQVAQAGTRCAFTGLDLLDIWRYFRHTWTTTYQSTPGRKIFLLVRDRASANHPVVGIAALGSPIVQLSVRDEWIGWTPTQVIAAITASPSGVWLKWLHNSLQALIADVYVKDFLNDKRVTRQAMRRPTEKVIAKLRQLAVEERRVHHLYPEQRQHKGASRRNTVRWSMQARTHLFRSKRASALADLLHARQLLQAIGVGNRAEAMSAQALQSEGAKRAISTVLRYTKAAHVGVEVMDLTVCGAVAPYNHILAGKLVSLLMASPEIRREYTRRYKTTASIIASSMAGRAVHRKPRLVLLGTTSLYGVAPSQYNRLKVPADTLGGDPSAAIEFKCLGKTAGFGSYHFSRATLESLEPLLGRLQRGRPVNSIFGEGVNPKLRKVRAALDAVGLPSNLLLQHGSPRLVYGIALAKNFREILLGLNARPMYLVRDRPEASERIVAFWRSRWLSPRIDSVDVIRAVESHSLIHPIRHGARIPSPDHSAPGDLYPLDADTRPSADTSLLGRPGSAPDRSLTGTSRNAHVAIAVAAHAGK